MLYSAYSGCVSAAQKVGSIDTLKFMAQPITDLKTLEENQDDMKTKMELLIMRIQVKTSGFLFLCNGRV